MITSLRLVMPPKMKNSANTKICRSGAFTPLVATMSAGTGSPEIGWPEMGSIVVVTLPTSGIKRRSPVRRSCRLRALLPILSNVGNRGWGLRRAAASYIRLQTGTYRQERIMATAVLRNSQMSEAEWEARQQLAACYRVFDMLGWSEMIYNHITLKLPGEEGAFLINPYGLHFSEVTASSLVKIDIDGNKLDDSPYPVNLAGFTQHALFHRHLPDAHCIMHTHTTAGMAVSSVEGGLRPTNFYACNFAGQIAYHDFEGVTVRSEEGERLIEHLGDKRVMLL